MKAIKTEDGTGIFYKDWGNGQPIVFHHGWNPSLAPRNAQCLHQSILLKMSAFGQFWGLTLTPATGRQTN
jgi:hypothetical protein